MLKILHQSLNFDFIWFHQTPHRRSGWSHLLKMSLFVLVIQSVLSASALEGTPLGLWPGLRLVCVSVYLQHTLLYVTSFLPSCYRMEEWCLTHWGRRPLIEVQLGSWCWSWQQATTWLCTAAMPRTRPKRSSRPRRGSGFIVSPKTAGRKAKNVLTEVKLLCALVLAVTAQSVTITTKQEELHRGQTVTLECQSGSSNPQANIFWKLGSQR